MRFEHADARAEGIIESISSGLDPEHDPDNREIEKENDVRDVAIGEGDGDDGGAAGDGQLVVMSSRCRQTMIRPSSPR